MDGTINLTLEFAPLARRPQAQALDREARRRFRRVRGYEASPKLIAALGRNGDNRGVTAAWTAWYRRCMWRIQGALALCLGLHDRGLSLDLRCRRRR